MIIDNDNSKTFLDKCLVILEYISYVLVLVAITSFVFAIIKEMFTGAILILVSVIFTFKCALSSRKTRN